MLTAFLAASGFVAIESLNIANITVTNQTFGVVTESTVSLVDDTSGVFGLGFPPLSSISASTNSKCYPGFGRGPRLKGLNSYTILR